MKPSQQRSNDLISDITSPSWSLRACPTGAPTRFRQAEQGPRTAPAGNGGPPRSAHTAQCSGLAAMRPCQHHDEEHCTHEGTTSAALSPCRLQPLGQELLFGSHPSAAYLSICSQCKLSGLQSPRSALSSSALSTSWCGSTTSLRYANKSSTLGRRRLRFSSAR